MVAKKAASAATIKTTPRSLMVPRSVLIAMILALVGAIIFINPYLGTVLFSALVAFIFNPVYKATLRRIQKPGLSVLITIVVATLSFVLPLTLILLITIGQASTLVNDLSSGSGDGADEITSIVERGAERVDSLLLAVPGGEKVQLDEGKIRDAASSALSAIASGLVTFIKKASGAFFNLITIFILSYFLISSMLRYQKELVDLLKRIIPFHESMTEVYLEKAGAMTKAMVKGQLIIATCQGFAAAFSLWISGVDFFWFWAVLLSFMSFIPLGAGIITIPIGIILMLSGNVWQGLFIIGWHLLVVTNIDNVLRPRLVPKSAKLNSALLLLSVFSGIAIFGAVGVVYGPVLMIIIVTTIAMYGDYMRTVKKVAMPAAVPEPVKA